jgi:hypothetical protein
LSHFLERGCPEKGQPFFVISFLGLIDLHLAGQPAFAGCAKYANHFTPGSPAVGR